MRVAVCIPSVGLIRSKCAKALNELVALTAGTTITFNGALTRPEFAFFYADMGPLEYKRTQLALRALQSGANYHLLMDWDHTFPPDALLKLAAHDLPMVGANYLMRDQEGGERRPTALSGQDQFITGTGVQQVLGIGLGFCLIKSRVFEATPKPWFQSEISDDGDMVRSEDVHFCNQVRRAGIPIHVDHDLNVKHIAEVELELERENASAETVLPAAGNLP